MSPYIPCGALGLVVAKNDPKELDKARFLWQFWGREHSRLTYLIVVGYFR